MSILKEIETDVFKDGEWTEEELQTKVDEDEIDADDAGIMWGASGCYREKA